MVKSYIGPDDSLFHGTKKQLMVFQGISFFFCLFNTISKHHKNFLLHLLDYFCGDFIYSHTIDQEILHPVYHASLKHDKF
jgi:hypothetical protein